MLASSILLIDIDAGAQRFTTVLSARPRDFYRGPEPMPHDLTSAAYALQQLATVGGRGHRTLLYINTPGCLESQMYRIFITFYIWLQYSAAWRFPSASCLTFR